MPLIGFRCKRGEVLFEDCFKECKERCRPLAFLKRCAIKRNIKEPTVTELCQSTCKMYLQRTVDYYSRPEDLEHLMDGQLCHTLLDIHLGQDYLTEERLKGNDAESGKFDLYNVKEHSLQDYKRTSMYKIKKAEQNVMASCFDYVLQLNNYRLKLEHYGMPVKSMGLWFWGKDLQAYERRQGKDNWKFVEVPFIRKTLVRTYFDLKRREFNRFMSSGTPLYACKAREIWGNRRCKYYCDVKHACNYWKENMARFEAEIEKEKEKSKAKGRKK